MNSLPDIMARLSDRLAFKILVVTCCLCLTVLVLLQVQDGEVHYIYNNFFRSGIVDSFIEKSLIFDLDNNSILVLFLYLS